MTRTDAFRAVRALLGAAAGLALLAGAAQARVVDAVETELGTLEISDQQGGGFDVRLDGELITEDVSAFSLVAAVALPPEGEGAAKLVVLQYDTGGAACPHYFQVLDASGRRFRLSEKFGTCSDLAEVTVVNGGIEIAIPVPGTETDETWRYVRGTLTKL